MQDKIITFALLCQAKNHQFNCLFTLTVICKVLLFVGSQAETSYKGKFGWWQNKVTNIIFTWACVCSYIIVYYATQ